MIQQVTNESRLNELEEVFLKLLAYLANTDRQNGEVYRTYHKYIQEKWEERDAGST